MILWPEWPGGPSKHRGSPGGGSHLSLVPTHPHRPAPLQAHTLLHSTPPPRTAQDESLPWRAVPWVHSQGTLVIGLEGTSDSRPGSCWVFAWIPQHWGAHSDLLLDRQGAGSDQENNSCWNPTSCDTPHWPEPWSPLCWEAASCSFCSHWFWIPGLALHLELCDLGQGTQPPRAPSVKWGY